MFFFACARDWANMVFLLPCGILQMTLLWMVNCRKSNLRAIEWIARKYRTGDMQNEHCKPNFQIKSDSKYVVGYSVQVMTQFRYVNIGRFQGNNDISVQIPSIDVSKAFEDFCYISLVPNIGFTTKFSFYQLPIRPKCQVLNDGFLVIKACNFE